MKHIAVFESLYESNRLITYKVIVYMIDLCNLDVKNINLVPISIIVQIYLMNNFLLTTGWADNTEQ